MDEYISREAVIKSVQYRVCQGHGNKEHMCKRGSCAYCGIMEIMDDIESIKAADVQPVKHGRWKLRCYGDYPYCSNCNNEPKSREMTLFCPNCGARMYGDNVRSFTDEETAIYESRIENEAKDTGLNIMDGGSE